MAGLLNISEAATIAAHACVALAADGSGTFIPVRQLAAESGFSKHHMAKVLKKLEKAGILKTERGPSGGARLAKPAKDISLYAIYVASGGEPFSGACLLKKSHCDGTCCRVGRLLATENQRLEKALQQTPLSSVVKTLQARQCTKPKTGRQKTMTTKSRR